MKQTWLVGFAVLTCVCHPQGVAGSKNGFVGDWSYQLKGPEDLGKLVVRKDHAWETFTDSGSTSGKGKWRLSGGLMLLDGWVKGKTLKLKLAKDGQTMTEVVKVGQESQLPRFERK